MKKGFAVAVMALCLPLVALAVPEGGPGSHHGPNIERLTKELNLSDEQKTKLKAIFKEQRAKHEALREEGHAKMQEVLTEDQMTKLDEMHERRKANWKKRKRCHKEGKE